MTMEEQVQVYKEDLELLSDKDMKMEYILDYGKEAKKLDLKYKTDDNIIKGCSSLAWMHKQFKDSNIILEAEGDSIIAKGMLVMLLEIFNNRTPDEILSFDSQLLMQMGVMELLSPVRQQGMEAFLGVIYGYANKCKEEGK
ncbi:cysteine desulfuration protein SufE [Epsilonproteobacteria bacterium SCGC AD-308-P11]|jgi:cysteine desulfuration protein SufE|nr:cysteine desulfuration protein SufE [Epsilonproteobacteria bacterium SCGC AD-308-P11]